MPGRVPLLPTAAAEAAQTPGHRVLLAGALTDGPVYRYHAQARDALDPGPSTSDCYFTVDSVRPHTPTVSSTDFPPEGEPAIMARTTGTVTVRLAGGDTDVDTFLWGMQQDALVNRIAVGDGRTDLVYAARDATARRDVSATRPGQDRRDGAGEPLDSGPIPSPRRRGSP
ncbi:hypothetical protein [Kutzneria sp. 744]|uniref:hypothetical protein n=1 Tax=Kutzneria sp. (strain 744) TaxID=345341 RepID=UPI0003EECDAE|nr:hypothetical protein [Kutzneria sp. 744]EWM17979.1 hypothetical protein KUTG_08283 [Kutzneria sp. 744]